MRTLRSRSGVQQALWQTKTLPRTALFATSTAFSFKVTWLVLMLTLALPGAIWRHFLLEMFWKIQYTNRCMCRIAEWLISIWEEKQGSGLIHLNSYFQSFLNHFREIVTPPFILPSPFWLRIWSGQDRGPEWSANLENTVKLWNVQVLPWWFSGWESAAQCRGSGCNPCWGAKIPHAAEQLSPSTTTTEPQRGRKRSWMLQLRPSAANKY